MKRKQLLLLLALLMTAATGAWAQGAKHSITATYSEQTRLLEQPLPYETTVGALYEAVTGESFSDLLSFLSAAYQLTLTGITSNEADVVSIGAFNDASTKVTVNDDGEATVRLNFGGLVKGIYVSVVPPLYVTMADGTQDAAKWTATVGTSSTANPLPVGGLNEDDAVTLTYGGRLKVKNVTATSDEKPAAPASWKLTLSSPAKDLYITANGGLIAQQTLDVASTEFTVEMPELTSQTVNIFATDGSGNCWYCTQENMSFATGQTYQSSPTMTALGTESSADVYKMTGAGEIPDGKTVVLSGVTISNRQIACSGNATIILMGANTVTAGNSKAAIKIGGSGTTLTITGSGSLTATGGDGGAGIGTDKVNNSTLSGGNIVINGGTVTAQGGKNGAGIGTGQAMMATNTCGDITINGGTVIAQGAEGGAGIGTGQIAKSPASNRCGAITIGTGVISVTAKKSSSNPGPNSIGIGKIAVSGTQNCGTITIGGTVYWDGSAYQNGGNTYLGQATIIYPEP